MIEGRNLKYKSKKKREKRDMAKGETAVRYVGYERKKRQNI